MPGNGASAQGSVLKTAMPGLAADGVQLLDSGALRAGKKELQKVTQHACERLYVTRVFFGFDGSALTRNSSCLTLLYIGT